MSRRPYELVVFDWDGTLIDSVGTIVACTRAAFARMGEPMPAEDAVRGAIGLGLAESVARFSPRSDAAFLERLTAAYRECWVEEYHALSRPFPASERLLRSLATDGYLLAVATAKSRRGLARDFERTGFEALFHASRTADETGSKPGPRMLFELMEELGVEARDTVMVGDTVHDLEMAANATVDAVAVCTGAAAREALVDLAPAACLAGVAELAEWLEGRRVAYPDDLFRAPRPAPGWGTPRPAPGPAPSGSPPRARPPAPASAPSPRGDAGRGRSAAPGGRPGR